MKIITPISYCMIFNAMQWCLVFLSLCGLWTITPFSIQSIVAPRVKLSKMLNGWRNISGLRSEKTICHCYYKRNSAYLCLLGTLRIYYVTWLKSLDLTFCLCMSVDSIYCSNIEEINPLISSMIFFCSVHNNILW